ncbi:MAG: Hsp20/alpha crystallin family protein [Candidatus Nanoarchaeia archaeon]
MYWDPFDEMREFQKRMNKAFESFFNRPEMKRLPLDIHTPYSDVIEKDDHVIVRMDLPGVEKEDIFLTVTDNNIEVRAQKKHELKVKKKGYFRHERSYGGFYRVVPLPANVNPDSAKAEYRNGVLEVKLQKSKTKKIAKKVKVE